MENLFNICKKVLIALSVMSMILAALAYYMRSKPPKAAKIDKNCLKQPKQTPTSRQPYKVKFNNQVYTITPKADYELNGLIVSENDFNDLLNIDYDSESINSKDLGIIWGSNLLGDDFHKVHFRNNAWILECRWYGDVNFNMNEVSNNHILAKGKIKEQIHDMGPGDQIYLKGMLVDYSFEMKNGSYNRKTSLTRDDRGNGACEVFLVEEVKIYRRSQHIWNYIFNIALSAIFILLIIRFCFFIIENSPKLRRYIYKSS